MNPESSNPNSIPNLLRDLFAEGAMSAAFVPTFTHQLTTRGKDSAWRLGRNVMTSLLVVTGVLALAGMVFADQLVWALASDYAAVPGKLQLTALLARIMLPTIAFIALAAAAMGMLNALHHFFIPALAPATPWTRTTSPSAFPICSAISSPKAQ